MGKRIKGLISNPYSFSMMTKIFCVLVGFLFTVFQARFLGAEIKGQVATVNSILGVTIVVFDFGISWAYPYFRRNCKEDVVPIFIKIAIAMLAVGLVVAIILIAVFDLPLKYMAVLVLTPLMIYEGMLSYITLIESPNRRHWVDVFVMLAELIFVVILWLLARPTFVLGLLVISLQKFLKVIIFTFVWRKRIFVKTESLVKWIPKFVKFGFVPMLSVLMSTLNYRVGVIMLDGRVPDAAIGIYSVGITLAERVWMIPDAIKGVMESRLAKGKDAEEAAFAIRICNTGCLVLILGILALGKPFINIVFGTEYSGAYEITALLLLGVFSMIYYKVIASFNIVMGKQRASFFLLTIAVVINLLINYLLIPSFGIYGAGVASVSSYSLCGLMFATYFCRTSKVPAKNILFIKKEDIAVARSFLKRK